MKAAIIVHGGAGSGTRKWYDKGKVFAEEYANFGYDMLKRGHKAVDVAVEIVSKFEDNPHFNAGYGSLPQFDGKVRMSAAIMDSERELVYGVVNIESIKNPIKAAFYLRDMGLVLVGKEATNYFRDKGFTMKNMLTEDRKDTLDKNRHKGPRLGYERKHGTVGAVAIDKEGNIAVASSTGGKGRELPGRMSDTATTAATYADSTIGISCTGLGEYIHSIGLAQRIAARSQTMSLEKAIKKSFDDLEKINGLAGVIAIKRFENGKADIEAYYNCKNMVWTSLY